MAKKFLLAISIIKNFLKKKFKNNISIYSIFIKFSKVYLIQELIQKK
jgi:hypothetical protein